MNTLPMFESPVGTPEFEQLVRELDELLEERSPADAEPTLEELFLARVGAAEPRERAA